METVAISSRLAPSLLMLAGIAGGIALLARYQNRLEKINQWRLFWIFSAVYALIACYLIRPGYHPLADAGQIYDGALAFREGNLAQFDRDGYMHIHPHQLGMLAYDLLLASVSQTPALNCAVNLLMILGINFTAWQISREITQDRLVHLLTLCLSFAFFPQLFFVLFLYGQVPGLFFLMLAFAFTLRFCRAQSWKSGVGAALCVAMAVALKKNYLIGGIAIILYLLLSFLQKPRFRKAAIAAVVAVCMLLPNPLLIRAFEGRTNSDLRNGCPSLLYVAMGTNLDNRMRAAGWFDGSNARIYWNEANGRADESNRIALRLIGQNFQNMFKDPAKAADFFSEKVISTWCEPLYQSLWSCSMARVDRQDIYTPLLHSLYGGGKAENIAEGCAAFLSLLMWLSVCAFILTSAKGKQEWMLMFLYLIGGFLFHLLSETKSQYVYPYVFCLTPFAAAGLRRLLSRISQGRS